MIYREEAISSNSDHKVPDGHTSIRQSCKSLSKQCEARIKRLGAKNSADYCNFHSALNLKLFGDTPTGLRQKMGLKKSANLRDHLTLDDLMRLESALFGTLQIADIADCQTPEDFNKVADKVCALVAHLSRPKPSPTP